MKVEGEKLFNMVFREKFDCVYEAEGFCGADLNNLNENVKIDLNHYACFSDIYFKIRRNGGFADLTYRVYLIKNNIPDKNFNLCTHLETKKILRCLQKTVPFSYKFSQAQYTESAYSKNIVDYDVLTVNIKGNYSQHLWITSMLRCFFEWPFNIAAKEACVLQSDIKKADGIDFDKENWINLYLTIAAQLGSYGLHGIVDANRHPKPRTYHEWKQKLESIKGCPRLIDSLRDGGFMDHSPRIQIDSQEKLDEGTKSRAAKYVAAYKDKLSWKK